MSQYQFLGNVTTFTKSENGIILTCDENKIEVTFLTSQIARVTLVRPGQIAEPAYAPAQTTWPGADFDFSETPTEIRLKSVVLEIRISRTPCRFAFYTDGELLRQDDPAFGAGWNGDKVAVFSQLFENERFFGLGEKAGALDRRGRELVMWNSDVPAYSDVDDPLYQSHPFFIGLREGQAYGFFLNNTYRTIFNMGAGNHRLTYVEADGGSLDYFIFAGPDIKSIISAYSQLVGRMPMPPKWALGYQQCRWSYYPENEVRTLAQTFRDRKIPADVLYLDIHYMRGYRCFTFDAERFPNPAQLLADLKFAGFKVVPIVDPGIKVDPGYAVYDSGLAGDHFIKYSDGEVYVGDVWPGPSHFANYTRPETREWWGNLHREFMEMGIAGIWNDMNEPANWGNSVPPMVEFDENGRKVPIGKIHNVFAHLMAQSTREGLLRLQPDQRPFILTRAGFSGTQRYAASWTGDNVSTFEHLEIAIRMCLSMGLSAIPFVGADVGGFADDPSAELFIRWIQVGAFTPFFRTHSALHTRAQEPWSFGKEAESIVREFIELRYRLLPYTYTAFREAHETGLPIMRPLLLEYPEEPEVFDVQNSTTYLWGEQILVAPVIRAHERIRKVYLPKGRWFDWRNHQEYTGGQSIFVDAPLAELPIFVRAGAVIPMREVQQFVDEKPLELLELHVYPGAGTSHLYEDDGQSLAYQNGEWARTEFVVAEKPNGQISLTIGKRTGNFAVPKRDFVVILHGPVPQSIQIDGKPVPASQIEFEAVKRTAGFRLTDAGSCEIVWKF